MISFRNIFANDITKMKALCEILPNDDVCLNITLVNERGEREKLWINSRGLKQKAAFDAIAKAINEAFNGDKP